MTDQPMAQGAVPKTPVGRDIQGQSFFDRLIGDARLRAWAQPVTFLGLGMVVIAYAILAFLIVNDREEARANAVRQSDNLVRIVNQSYSHIFQNVDSALIFLRRTYLAPSSTDELQAWLDDPTVRTDMALYYAIVDAQGRIVAASRGPGTGPAAKLIGENVADRDYFQRQRETTSDELFFSEPITSRLTGRAVILITRRVTAANGTFAGIVAAIITPDALTRVGIDLDLGPNGTFGLIGFDGVVRARAVDGKVAPNSIGTHLPPGAGVLGHVIHAPNGYFWSTPGLFDQIDRLVSYRVVGDFPMIATVARAKADIFRHTNRQAQIYWAIALLITIVIFLGIKWGVAREQKLMAATAEILSTQEHLRRSQERYRLVEEAVNDGVWDWNIKTGTSYRSRRWKKILGYEDHEIPPAGETFRTLIHPDDRPHFEEALRAHLQDDKPYGLEFRLQHKDGSYRWVQSRGKAQRDADGEPVRMLGTLTDITARMQAEASLKESRDNLTRAERLALLGHFKSELGSKTLTCSDGVCSILGISPQSHTASMRRFFRMVAPEDRPSVKRARAEVLAGQEVPNFLVRFRRGDAVMVDLELWITPVRDHAGTIVGVFGTVQDVSSRRRAEELLARANQELEARVTARTAELAQEMRRREEAQMTLGQMQKMEAVGQLTAGVAHDFNNLLAVIAGSLEFVDRAAARGLTADPELIDAAMRATRRGRELVRRLLAFSRQTPLRAEPTAIDQMVLDTLRLLQRTLGQNIDLVTRLNAKGAVISADRNQLANALLNLALNARDAMPDGGQITIATECRPCEPALARTSRCPTGEDVYITISDTGIGMTEEVLGRAVEPFFTTKTDGLGSGLGLSMVQGFTEQSGGLLNIESKPHFGTSVTIRLPRIASPGHTEDIDAGIAGAGTERGKTVLLVEDDGDVRIVTSAQLRHLGYKVHAVANGMEAIDLVASPATIDILLTDIVLPGGLDGVSLIKEAMATRPGIGILCMSGYDPAQKHRRWLNMQNIVFLEKPFNTQKLGQALDGAVAR